MTTEHKKDPVPIADAHLNKPIVEVEGALTQNYIKVQADQRPSALLNGVNGNDVVYAVFSPEADTFMGLVTAEHISRYPQRIFADLLPRPVPEPLHSMDTLETAVLRCKDGSQVMPVIDENKKLTGIVTSNTLLATLLATHHEQTGNLSLPAPEKCLDILARLLNLLGSQHRGGSTPQSILGMLAEHTGARAGAIVTINKGGCVVQATCMSMSQEEAERLAFIVDLSKKDIGWTAYIPNIEEDPDFRDLQYYLPSCYSLLSSVVGQYDEGCDVLYLVGERERAFGERDAQIIRLCAKLMGTVQHHIHEHGHQGPLEEFPHLASMVFEHNQAAIMITDADQHILAVNPAFTFVTGYKPEDVLGKSPRVLSSGEQDASFYRHMWTCIKARGEWQGEIRNRRKNGEVYTEWLKINAVCDRQGHVTHYLATFLDITESLRTDKEIERLVNYDPLTGLPNRILAREHIKQSLVASTCSRKHVALLFIDIDHFKDINDSLGHIVGDKVIQLVAKRMVACVRSHLRTNEQDFVARQGGDEFTLLLRELDKPDEASAIADRLIDAFREPFRVENNTLYLSASIGVALYPRDASTIDELVSRADMAMYEAKRNGRGTYRFFNKGLAVRNKEHLKLKNDLHRALREEEFFLEYQPRLTIREDRITSFEALMRWSHPELGVIPPTRFIPLLEESSILVDVTEWLLHEACRRCKSWRASTSDENLKVAINISAKQFRDPGLVELIRHSLDENHLPPSGLEVELTESVAIQDIESTITILKKLSDIGIECHLDDFGTGYSSLSYLRDFHLAGLKIDKSFVARTPQHTRDNAVVRAIISTAHSLNMKVIAEGVETAAQKEFLSKEGCDEYQGYLFSRPVGQEDVEGMLVTAMGMELSMNKRCKK